MSESDTPPGQHPLQVAMIGLRKEAQQHTRPWTRMMAKLERVEQARHLPYYARQAAQDAAELIRFLSEELALRGVIIDKLYKGENPWAPPATDARGLLAE